MQYHPFPIRRRRTFRWRLAGRKIGPAPIPVLVKTDSAMGRPDGGHTPTRTGAWNRCFLAHSFYLPIELGHEFIFSSKTKYVFDVIIKLT